MRAWPGYVLFTLAWLGGCGGASISAAPDEPAALDEQQPAPQDGRRGPLVLAVVIDQLGSETLTKLEPLLEPNGAFARARSAGRSPRRVTQRSSRARRPPSRA
jgi:hypothetical protein